MTDRDCLRPQPFHFGAVASSFPRSVASLALAVPVFVSRVLGVVFMTLRTMRPLFRGNATVRV